MSVTVCYSWCQLRELINESKSNLNCFTNNKKVCGPHGAVVWPCLVSEFLKILIFFTNYIYFENLNSLFQFVCLIDWWERERQKWKTMWSFLIDLLKKSVFLFSDDFFLINQSFTILRNEMQIFLFSFFNFKTIKNIFSFLKKSEVKK